MNMIPVTAHSHFDFTVINICCLCWDLYSASLQHQKHFHLAVEAHANSVANCSDLVWQVRFSRSLSDGQIEWLLWSTLASFSDSHTSRFNCMQYSSIGAVAVVGALIATENPTYKLTTCITKGDPNFSWHTLYLFWNHKMTFHNCLPNACAFLFCRQWIFLLLLKKGHCKVCVMSWKQGFLWTQQTKYDVHTFDTYTIQLFVLESEYLCFMTS